MAQQSSANIVHLKAKFPCPECKAPIGTHAGECPHCNAIFTQKEWECRQLEGTILESESAPDQPNRSVGTVRFKNMKIYRSAWAWGFWTGLLLPVSWAVAIAQCLVERHHEDKAVRYKAGVRLRGSVAGLITALFCIGMIWLAVGFMRLCSTPELHEGETSEAPVNALEVHSPRALEGQQAGKFSQKRADGPPHSNAGLESGDWVISNSATNPDGRRKPDTRITEAEVLEMAAVRDRRGSMTFKKEQGRKSGMDDEEDDKISQYRGDRAEETKAEDASDSNGSTTKIKKAQLFVLTSGKLITAATSVDFGAVYTIRTPRGTYMTIPKKDILEIRPTKYNPQHFK